VFENCMAQNYKSHWIAKIPGMTKWMGNMIFNSVDPKNVKKVKTFAVFEPTQSNIDEKILQEFEENQDTLKTFIDNMEGLEISKIVVSSPVNPYIVYTLEKALEIIIAHEQRHFNQAKGVLEDHSKNQ